MNEQMVPAAAAAKQQQQIQHAPQADVTVSGSNETVKVSIFELWMNKWSLHLQPQSNSNKYNMLHKRMQQYLGQMTL